MHVPMEMLKAAANFRMTHIPFTSPVTAARWMRWPAGPPPSCSTSRPASCGPARGRWYGPAVRIFVSYSSRQRDLCERLRLALEADGRHQVFVDRAELAPGAPFDETLRHGIASCDLFLFLVSPDSVAAGGYARAELSMAQARWRHPAGHVLPVMVAPTRTEDIPPYLRAVTILEPQGDVVAEAAAAVEA